MIWSLHSLHMSWAARVGVRSIIIIIIIIINGLRVATRGTIYMYVLTSDLIVDTTQTEKCQGMYSIVVI